MYRSKSMLCMYICKRQIPSKEKRKEKRMEIKKGRELKKRKEEKEYHLVI